MTEEIKVTRGYRPTPGMGDNLIDTFMQQIGRYPLLGAEGEVEAFKLLHVNEKALFTVLLKYPEARDILSEACHDYRSGDSSLGMLVKGFDPLHLDAGDPKENKKYQALAKKMCLSIGYGANGPTLVGMVTDLQPSIRVTRAMVNATKQYKDVADKWEACQDTRNSIVNANLRLVAAIAKHYANSGPNGSFTNNFLDYVNEGTLGLITAVEKFQSARGHRFSTYASCWVMQAIARTIAKNKLIKIPSNKRENMPKYIKLVDQMLDETGERPTHETVAKELGVTVQMAKLLEQISCHNYVYLDSVLPGQTTPMDKLQADSPTVDNVMIKLEQQDILLAAVSTLDPRTAKVLEYRFGLNGVRTHTLKEVGAILHTSSERVRQIEIAGINKLKRRVKIDGDGSLKVINV